MTCGLVVTGIGLCDELVASGWDVTIRRPGGGRAKMLSAVGVIGFTGFGK